MRRGLKSTQESWVAFPLFQELLDHVVVPCQEIMHRMVAASIAGGNVSNNNKLDGMPIVDLIVPETERCDAYTTAHAPLVH